MFERRYCWSSFIPASVRSIHVALSLLALLCEETVSDLLILLLADSRIVSCWATPNVVAHLVLNVQGGF